MKLSKALLALTSALVATAGAMEAGVNVVESSSIETSSKKAKSTSGTKKAKKPKSSTESPSRAPTPKPTFMPGPPDPIVPDPSDERRPLEECQSASLFIRSTDSPTRSPSPTAAPSKISKSAKKGSKARRLSIPDDRCFCPCCDEITCQAFYGVGSSDNFSFFENENEICRVDIVDWETCSYEKNVAGAFEFGSVNPAKKSPYVTCCYQWLVTGCGDRDRRLNDISSSNERQVTENEDGVSVEVKSNHPEGLNWIKDHVDNMKDRIENGEVARAWDPLFKAYFDNIEDISMDCDHDDGSMKCSYKSETTCGVDLIKAHAGYHAKIANAIREEGSHEIYDEHLVPESCQ